MTSVWRAVPENNNPHPAPFPLWLPARVIISILDGKRKGLVLDPYVGSGTTAVAAKLLGFDYLGIDIGKEYINYAKERLLKAKDEEDKIIKEQEIHKISKTFKMRKELGEKTGKYSIQ